MLHRRRFKICLSLILIFLMASVSLWQTINVHLSFPEEKPAYRTNVTYTYPTNELAENDYRRLIDLDTFKFLIIDEVCPAEPTLLVLVHTAPTNFRKRTTIRETWGKHRDGMSIVFMLGYTEDAKIQDKLMEENRIYRDFAQGNFLDSYKNMTYKHVMVLKYAIYHCPQAKYILKTDDDVFVNVYTMMTLLNEDFSPNGCSNLLMCKVMKNKPVSRSYRSKWRVTVKEYPMRTYVPYCLGFAVLYSQDVAFVLYKEAQRGDYFWIDDVHVTGTLAKKTNVILTDVNPYILESKSIEDLRNKGEISFQFLYSSWNAPEREIRMLWDYVNL